MNEITEPRKFDTDKPQINLIPGVCLVEMGKVLAFGAKKYSRGNWAKGLATSRYYDAAMRHLLAWNSGEDCDPESGLTHLAHAAVNLSFMMWNMVFRRDLDDRWHTQYKTPAQLTVEPFWGCAHKSSDSKSISPVFASRELAEKWINQQQLPDFEPIPVDKDGERR